MNVLIIGLDFFGYGFDQQYFNTALPTSELDEVTIGAGMYDELFVSVDETMQADQNIPDDWTLMTVMDADFNNSLEAGSIDGDGRVVTDIQCYRREYASTNNAWQLVAQFPYDSNYNLYTVVDRFIENHKTYEYCVIPLSHEIMGEMLINKEPVTSEFEGMFISDIDANYSMNIDFQFADLTYNTNMATSVPLNGKYPIISFGNAEYRTGSATFLPLTPQQEFGYSSEINAHDEFVNRQNIIKFLNNGKAKVIRREDGDVIVCATTNVKTTAKSEALDAISTVTFDFTEIGGLDYNTMEKAGLIASAGKSVYTYDDEGGIKWNSEYNNDGARRRYENSFDQVSA